MNADELVARLKEQVKAEGGIVKFCANHGICQGNLTKVLYCGEKPGPQIALAVGMKKVITFEPVSNTQQSTEGKTPESGGKGR